MVRAIVVGALSLSWVFLSHAATGRAAEEEKAEPAAHAEALARYNGLRAETPHTAAAQSKLALWCEEHGLSVEARVHFAEVVTLDPKREAAWRKLGFKKHDGRWMTDAQIASAEDDVKAIRLWGPKLRAWHKDIHGGKKQAEALAGIATITDPRAIPAVYHEFGHGGTADQTIAIQILGQIDSPVASKVLAMTSIYGRNDEVRRLATETLRQRPPGEFLDLLVATMTDPIKYEVKPVGGPGSPGVLFVEGERFNVARFYAPPPPPTVAPQPGDMIAYDDFGMPVITRMFSLPDGSSEVHRVSKTLIQRTRNQVQATARYSATANAIEAQRAALAAQDQLAADVGRVEAMNRDINTFNDLVRNVAKDATGTDAGPTPKDWRDTLVKNPEYARKPRPKPTFNEIVPLAYTPAYNAFTPISFMRTTATQITKDL